jgi:hypothetical protein
MEIVKQMLRAGQLAAKLQILRQDRSHLRAISEGVHIQQQDKVTEDLRRALVQFFVMQLRAIVANLMRIRQARTGEKNCGAGAPGSQGFQPGNTCAGGSSSSANSSAGSGLAAGDFSEFLATPEPNKIEYTVSKTPSELMQSMMPGIDWTDDEAEAAMCGLTGVPDGWDVVIDQPYPGVIVVDASLPEDGPMGFASSMTRQIEIENGKVVIYNKEFELSKDQRGKGAAVRMLAREVAWAQKYDIGNIRTTAAGDGLLRPSRLHQRPGASLTERSVTEYTGVVVWPNLGFDSRLDRDFSPYIKFGKFPTPDSVKSATKISDIVRTEEGQEWWNNHGTAHNVVFDPKPGSLSTRVLAKVAERKGIRGTNTTATSAKTYPSSTRSGPKSTLKTPLGSQPNTTAEGLSRLVFDPREWDKQLIETLMVPYAEAYITAASSEIEIAKIAAERKSVDISRSKMVRDYDQWRTRCPTGSGKGIGTKASTASHFLRQQKELQLEEMVVVTPLGEFRFNISTEYPKWMKRRLRELLEETFSQDYWKQINDTTSADITDILQRGIRDGWSIDDMADEIADGLPGDSDYAKDRATAIARTESGHALNGARSAAIDDLAEELAPYGLPMKKSWMSVLGSTTRETHADADGVPADIEGMWTIGGFRCRWPGDTMLPAYERVNCMCTILSEYGLTDTEANELIEDYNTRVQEREQFYRSQGKSYADMKSCGAGKPGAVGFQENNTCAGGGGSEDEPYHPVLNPEGRHSNEDDEEQKKLPIELPEKPLPLYGVESDADAPTVLVEDKDGNKITVVDRSDTNGHAYLDEVEADAEARGLAVDFDTVQEMQDEAGIDDDSGAFQAYVGDAYKAFTDEDGDIPSGVEDTIDTYGYNHGSIDSDYASTLIDERMAEAESEWESMDHASEIDGWDDMKLADQEDAYSEWIDAKRSEIESDIEDQRHEARQEAISGMRQELESGAASSTLVCCAQLYRGISISETRLQEMIEEGEVSHSGVNSWTTSRETAKNFTGGGASRRQVILVARSPKAGFVNKTNALDEKEVIRPPSTMKIKQVVKTKTMIFLYVDEDPDYAE